MADIDYDSHLEKGVDMKETGWDIQLGKNVQDTVIKFKGRNVLNASKVTISIDAKKGRTEAVIELIDVKAKGMLPEGSVLLVNGVQLKGGCDVSDNDKED